MSQNVRKPWRFILLVALAQLGLGLALVPLGGTAWPFNVAVFVFFCGVAVGMVVTGRRP